jgi:hypothetical protein
MESVTESVSVADTGYVSSELEIRANKKKYIIHSQGKEYEYICYNMIKQSYEYAE